MIAISLPVRWVLAPKRPWVFGFVEFFSPWVFAKVVKKKPALKRFLLRWLKLNHIAKQWGGGIIDLSLVQAFFLTSAAKKTKTQAQNSSQKLKKKTQPQGGSFLPSRKTQGKNSILRIFLKKLKGLDLLCYFYYKIFSKSVHFEWKLKFCTEF